MPRKTVIYARADTPDEMTQQVQDGIEYVRDELDRDIPHEHTIPPYNDEVNRELSQQADVTWSWDTEDTYPDSLEGTLKAARNDGIEHVIVPHLYDVSESMRDVRDTIETMHAAGVTVHIEDRRVSLEPRDVEKRALLTEASEFERMDNARQLDPATAGEPHKGGRPPLGYVVENGYRRPGPEYDDIEATLHDVVSEKLSIHRAAARLDVSRTTIRNAVEQRPGLYGLPADAALPSR